jgi:hypothetical protein
MVNQTSDVTVLMLIDQLVKEEQELYGQGRLSGDDQLRLDEIRVQLDQCWDLLRQRRALREFGKDPDNARPRPAEIVEKYEQ